MSCDPCKHGNNPFSCQECYAEFRAAEKANRGPHGPKGVTIIDRRASQQPDEPKRKEKAIRAMLMSTMAGMSMSILDSESRVDPARRQAMQKQYDREMQPYRSNRKRKNKAARKARRANR